MYINSNTTWACLQSGSTRLVCVYRREIPVCLKPHIWVFICVVISPISIEDKWSHPSLPLPPYFPPSLLSPTIPCLSPNLSRPHLVCPAEILMPQPPNRLRLPCYLVCYRCMNCATLLVQGSHGKTHSGDVLWPVGWHGIACCALLPAIVINLPSYGVAVHCIYVLPSSQYMRAHTHTHTHTHTRTHMCIHTYTHTHTTHMCIHIHTHTHTTHLCTPLNRWVMCADYGAQYLREQHAIFEGLVADRISSSSTGSPLTHQVSLYWSSPFRTSGMT